MRFLGNEAAFGVSVRKKDGLHQAQLVIVILVALYIIMGFWCGLFCLFSKMEEWNLCMEDYTNQGDASQADEIKKL